MCISRQYILPEHQLLSADYVNKLLGRLVGGRLSLTACGALWPADDFVGLVGGFR